MKWSDKEEEALMLCQQRGGGWPQIAALAVQLAAARGGTMTAHELRHVLEWVRDHNLMGPFLKLERHIAAQGARIAVLESDVAKARQSEDVWRKRLEAAAVALGAHGAGQVGRLDIVARVRILLDNTAQSRQREECIRRRSLEAGNLERIISEHGLPTAMRWVVEGKEPEQSTATHGDYGGELREEHEEIQHYPSSPLCTHPERVKERSEAVERPTFRDGRDEGYTEGAEAMRAACWDAVDEVLTVNGLAGPGRSPIWDALKAAIEGATP